MSFRITSSFGSSHREAPMISRDPLADNTDLYAFRSPDDTSTITILANYIPFESPEGGPNYYSFGENIRYEIHINNGSSKGEIIYRFMFSHLNEDASTFFNIRLGKQNIKTTYQVEKSVDGGKSFSVVLKNGVVPPPNVGPRTITGAVGLGKTDYATIMKSAIDTLGNKNEKVFAGPVDDPFFVDLAGAFDLGNFRFAGQTDNMTKDGFARFNVHTIALRIPISSLQKDGKGTGSAKSILDGDFVIGVWASASRQSVSTLSTTDATPTTSGNWVQVSRIGMPLTNEVIIPVGEKDRWNAGNPANDTSFAKYFTNPELALYMDTTKFAAAVPALCKLRIPHKSLGAYGFNNGEDGLFGLAGNSALDSTALAPGSKGGFGDILLQSKSPRSVDLLPIFYTGVPNLRPYQLATGKNGNPLAKGKPFINNFLPTLGDMLRLNMAVPVTPRTSADFSSLGIIKAAVLGLLDPRFNGNTKIQNIPNMDGFPNGRRLEDDVTTIEMQAVSGVALAAIGLWPDDYHVKGSRSPVTQRLVSILSFTAGPTQNDTTFNTTFPFVQQPWNGFNYSQSK